MKKLFLSLSLAFLFSVAAIAQNVQLHYDLGRSIYDELDTRPKLTSTVEMFKPDSWGSTFFFVDMDYTKDGVAGAYWEIARELQFWKAPFSLHVEYNGGLNEYTKFNNAYLLGATYSFNNKDFTAGFTLTPAYKYIQNNSSPNSFQFTTTWYLHFAKGLLSFSGFIDYWKEENCNAAGKDYIFLTEPQLWLNLNKIKGVNEKFNLSIGTEWEMSNNFGGRDGFYFIPTLALKWAFN